MKRIQLIIPIFAILLAGCGSSSSESSSASSVPSSSISSTSNVISSSSSSSSATSSSSSSSSTPSSSSSSSSIPSSSSTTSQEGIIFPEISVISTEPTYYSDINSSLTGTSLKSALKTLISQNVSVSYDWSRFEYADQDLSNTSNVMTIYARYSYAKTAHVDNATPNRWNREHTYPQSKISDTAAKDNHHIFADDWKTNSVRSNNKFADLNPATSTRVIDSGGRTTDNYTNGSYFEPLDAAKGEVARATLYLNTMYGYTLEDNFQTAELAVLWALYYPVNDWAMTRNNRVYSRQGNRNPYIDDQTYICKVYGNTSTTTQQLCADYL